MTNIMNTHASMPLQYKRLYKGLLDADEIFESLEAAKEYASGPIGCPGHIITVLVDGIRKSYIVNDDGTISALLLDSDIEIMLSWETLSEVDEPDINKPFDGPGIITKSGKILKTKNDKIIVYK